MSTRVEIHDLKPGMIILEVSRQNGPVKIKKSGLVSSTQMIQGLAEMGVQEVIIDPAQTVEVEAPLVTKSKTQKLLEQEANREQGLDHALSEQFNRSLFLPSVSELPSAWQVYLRHGVMASVLLVGGFATGWTVANIDNWYAAYQQVNEPVQLPITEQSPPVQEVSTLQVKQPPVTTTEPATQPSEEPQVTAQQLDVPELQGQERVLGYVPEDSEALMEQATAEGDSAAGALNPELVKRFEQAIADLDSEPQSEPVAPAVSAEPTVPKVHELPAWILTELPSMAFSAHMYASDPNERWIRVNGQRLVEGQYLNDDLRLVQIDPQHVILAYKGQEFSMAALTDW